jgi:hypothetical protein
MTARRYFRPARMLIPSLVTALLLATPAIAQVDQSARIEQRGGSSQNRVIQQSDEDSRVSIQQRDRTTSSGSDDCHGPGCEISSGSGDDNPAPRGGVDTGYGGMAREGKQAESSVAVALILGGALSALLGVRLWRRRT